MSHNISVRTRWIKTAVAINGTNTDQATITGLPAKYRVTRMMVFDPSADLSLNIATVGLYTAAGAGGTAVVVPALITGLTGATKFADMTLAVAADYLTASTLYVRNAVASLTAQTVSVLVEIIDLTAL